MQNHFRPHTCTAPVFPMQRFAVTRGSMPMEVDLKELLEKCVFAGTMEKEVVAATKFCTEFLEKFLEPTGLSAPLVPLPELKAKAHKLVGTGAKCIFGGSLGMIDLDARIRPPSDLDLARMRWACENLVTAQDLPTMLGTIVVQGELGTASSKLGRVERDAEIDMALLAMYWHKEKEKTLQALAESSRNLVLSAEALGSGIDLHIERFSRYEKEEQKRHVLGQSSFRKSLALRDLVEAARNQREGQSDAELAARLLTQRQDLKAWNKDTCRRYLQVAERMQDPKMQRLMTRWEFLFKRDTLVDGIMILRAALATTPRDDSLFHVLETLFFEQVCKMRNTLKPKSRAGFEAIHIMRGILLREAFYQYCRHIFPKLADAIAEFGTWRYYNRRFGMTEAGHIQGQGCTPQATETGTLEGQGCTPQATETRTLEGQGCTPQDQRDEPSDLDENASRFLSKLLLREFMNAVASNRHESAFSSLAKDVGNAGPLDLTKDSMRGIQTKLQAIQTTYTSDFPPDLAPAIAVGGAACVDIQGQTGSYVRVSSTIATEEEYQTKLSEWTEACEKLEREATNSYITSRVVLAIAKYHTDELEAVLKRISMLQEAGRKLFVYDSLVVEPLNWTKLRKHKRSWLTCNKVAMDLNSVGTDSGDTLAPLKNMYSHFRTTQGDKGSEDVVAVLVPGLSTDTPENMPLRNAFNSLRALTPKHIGPKIGTVQLQQSGVVRQMVLKGGTQWNRMRENHLVFCYQNPSKATEGEGRKRMKYLQGGDTYFNNWPTPVLPPSGMAKITEAVHTEIFAQDVCWDSGEEDDTMDLDGCTLAETLTPFPRETHHKLTCEMIHVFNIQVLVAFCPGSGESLLACLLENIRGIGVCKNKAHKTFLMDRLCEMVKMHKLARFTPLAKYPELVEWESKRGRASASPPGATSASPASFTAAPSDKQMPEKTKNPPAEPCTLQAPLPEPEKPKSLTAGPSIPKPSIVGANPRARPQFVAFGQSLL